MTVKTYDQRSRDLAEYFIGDGPKGSESAKKCDELALVIQGAIEDWIENMRRDDEYEAQHGSR